MPRNKFKNSGKILGEFVKNGNMGILNKNKVKKLLGVDDLLDCLSPSSFDIACVFENIDFLINSNLNRFYLNCSLGSFTPHPTIINRKVASGSCNSWWGIPFLGNPQKCANFDSATLAFQACNKKAQSEGLFYEASGCDDNIIWCWARTEPILI